MTAAMRRLAISIAIGALVGCGSGGQPAAPASDEGAAGESGSGAAGSAPGSGAATASETGERTATGEASASETGEGTATGSGGGAQTAAAASAEPSVAADACVRARACCPAYAAALPNPGEHANAEQACASLDIAIAAGGPPADAACQGALEGFRRSLEASGRSIPAACQ